MKRALFVVCVLAVGCADGGGLYHNTDISEVAGFRVVTAGIANIAGPGPAEGTLVYEGNGDIEILIREYIINMEEQGWMLKDRSLAEGKGSAMMVKDSRTCTIEFARTDGEEEGSIGKIRASISVGLGSNR